MPELFGWVAPELRTRSVQASFERLQENQYVFLREAFDLRDSGAGEIALLYKSLEKVHGRFPVNNQTIGDCVSHGYAKCIEVLMAVEIVLRKDPEIWPGVLTATEWIYGTSRVIQGGGRLGNQDGSLGVWGQQAVKDNGTLLRKKYEGVDLTTYSGSKAKDWGYRGLPHELENIADLHPVKTTALVKTYNQARDAISNGYPVAVCSNRGFRSSRDAEGFASPSGSWAHCMAFVAVDDQFRRPGLLCMNSWGETWISGPKRHEQPEGSFWVDADTVDQMLGEDDSYALSNFEGYPSRNLDPTLWD